MTLEQLKMLKLVSEFGSLKKAGEHMHKTQPAISQGIKQLESGLGVSLFNREGYRLVLTPEGDKIYQHALKVLNETSEIEQLAKHFAQGNEASISLAFEASFDLNLILPVLDKTQSEFPDTQIIIRQEHITGAYDSVINSSVDIALSPLIEYMSQQNNKVKFFQSLLATGPSIRFFNFIAL